MKETKEKKQKDMGLLLLGNQRMSDDERGTDHK